jgi:hypothetical protein
VGGARGGHVVIFGPKLAFLKIYFLKVLNPKPHIN